MKNLARSLSTTPFALVLFLTLFLSHTKLIGQCPASLSPTFTNQAALDTFKVKYPNCTELANVTINSATITNLQALNNLKSITGNFVVYNCSQLQNLEGLNALERVGSKLELQENIALENLNGLTKLDSVGDLKIFNNSNLTSLSGVSALRRVRWTLTITNNSKLKNLIGFSNLIYTGGCTIQNNSTLENCLGLENLYGVGGTLQIENNPKLTTLQGLSRVENIGGQCTITNNPELKDLSGLSNLKKIWNSFSILGNNALQNLEGLDSLQSISGNFIVNNNLALLDLIGLETLKTVSQSVQINYNPVLQTLHGLENLSSVGLNLTIQGNPQLKNVTHLSGLKTVANILEITENTGLESIGPFQTLNDIRNSLNIYGNSSLKTIYSFDALKDVATTILIRSNLLLDSISGFNGMEVCRAKIDINNNPNLQSISGFEQLKTVNAKISIQMNPILEHLSAFQNVKKITALSIGNNVLLNDVHDFEQLTQITDLVITDNLGLLEFPTFPFLKSANTIFIQNNGVQELMGFDSLAEMSGILSIKSNPTMTRIQGFNNFKLTSSNIVIENNPTLISLSGFNALELIGGNLNINYNYKMTHISGFHATKQMAGFSLQSDTSLVSFYGLESLTRISTDATLYDNSQLPNLPLFDSLKFVGGNMRIAYNNQLFSLNHLGSLDTVADYLSIQSNPKLVNLIGLNNLKSVSTLLISDNKGLQSIAELDQLTGISTNLTIDNNPVLQSLVGLQNLQSIGSDLKIEKNAILPNLQGLEGLKSLKNLTIQLSPNLLEIQTLQNLHTVNGTVNINSNPMLTNLRGLHTIQSMENLNIINNNALQTLDGFDSLRFIRYNLTITGNENLAQLTGMNRLKQIWGIFTLKNTVKVANFIGLDSLDFASSLVITSNAALKDMKGLEKMTNLNGIFTVQQNPLLETLSGLNELKQVNGLIKITDNSLLGYCSLLALCNKLTLAPNAITITNNYKGCATKDEISDRCGLEYSQLRGKIYRDVACDSVFNPTEDRILQYHLIKDKNTLKPIACTDAVGTYFTYINPNSSNTMATKAPLGFYVKPDSIFIATDSVIRLYDNLDFSICVDSSFHNLTLTVTPYQLPRPGFSHSYKVCVQNNGVLKENATLNFDFDPPNHGFIQILNTEGGSVNGHTITWNLFNLDVFEKRCFTVDVEISASAPIGTYLFASGEVFITDTSAVDAFLSDNQVRLIERVVGSYDPNNKMADSHKITLDTLGNPVEIEYTVRFQNTGNFPASFVEVADTLAQNLDVRSIEMIDASHDYVLSFPAENVLHWRFDGINLPDSASNEAGSQGFVRFKIATKSNVELYEQIKNSVAIYFDFNEPVLTDTSYMTACPPLTLNTFAVKSKCNLANGVGIAQVLEQGQYSFLWSNGSTSPKASGLVPGLYVVTVTGDSAACASIGFAVVESIPAPIAVLDAMYDVQCFGNSDGKIEVSATLGTPPYLFIWSSGDTAMVLTDLAAGQYELLLRDARGCVDSLLQVTISEPAALSVQATVLNQSSLTTPDGAITTNTSGGTAPFQYFWSNGATSPMLSQIAAGVYTLTLTDAHACESIQSFVVNFTVATQNPGEEQNLSLVPNPTKGQFFIQTTENIGKKAEIRILDARGSLLLSQNVRLQQQTNLDCSAYPSGLYFVEILVEDAAPVLLRLVRVGF